jgi:hypothetical protein
MSSNKALKRPHAIDLASMAFLFICGSLFAGRVWRFPFDDEIFTLSLIARVSARTPLQLFQDVHPPLSYFLFYILRQLGLSDAGMRLCSLTMTLLALLIFQFLTLTWIARRSEKPNTVSTRVIAVLLFGMCPLAVSLGADSGRFHA